MIVSIVADYFRKHEHLDLTLQPGLNVLRGPNEAGKTTVTEAVLYALYGSKALRNTLADTVTWGHKESELKVKLVIRIGGVDYTFTRSKAGAECTSTQNGATIKATGQDVVSGMAANLLGADAKTAGLLMLSSQSGLRGALADGPTAVSALMGKLADFDTIDRLLEGANNTLALGAELPWTTKIAQAEADLQAARDAINPVDVAAFLAGDESRLAHECMLADEGRDKLHDAMTLADEALGEGKGQVQDRAHAGSALDKLKLDLVNEQLRLKAAQAEAAKVPDAARMQHLQTEIAAIAGQATVLAAYQAFKNLGPYPGVAWDEPVESFDLAMGAVANRLEGMKLRRREIEGELKQLNASRITNGKCPTCGSTKTSDEHVAKINGEIDSKVKPLQAEYEKLNAETFDASTESAAMEAVAREARRRDTITSRIANYLSFDASVYPARVEWAAEVPVVRDAAPLRAELQTLNSAAEAATRAQGRVSAHTAAISELTISIARSQAAFDLLPMPDLIKLTEAYEAAYAAYIAASGKAVDLHKRHEQILHEISEAKRQAAEVEQRMADAQARLDQARKDLEVLQFNNIFVKKLRALKPAITDFLWNSVLAAVSNFFSTLRGEQSIVTKTSDGFRVNGQSIESLSGSTLDVLALAIRVALSKTFVPHASFMVLDEPAAGCDLTRTGNLLGFLSGVGFEQVLLASHDELSESVANNVITVGD